MYIFSRLWNLSRLRDWHQPISFKLSAQMVLNLKTYLNYDMLRRLAPPVHVPLWVYLWVFESCLADHLLKLIPIRAHAQVVPGVNSHSSITAFIEFLYNVYLLWVKIFIPKLREHTYVLWCKLFFLVFVLMLETIN